MNSHQRRVRRRAIERWHRALVTRFLADDDAVIITIACDIPEADITEFLTMFNSMVKETSPIALDAT